MNHRIRARIAPFAAIGLAWFVGACSGGDDPLVGARMPTTTAPEPGAGLEAGETVDVADTLGLIEVAERSNDFCDVARALGAPLPTAAGPAVVEIYERLAALVGSSGKLVPGDDAFPTFDADWQQLETTLRDAAGALVDADGDTTNPVFVAILRGDSAVRAIETVERFRRERCDGA